MNDVILASVQGGAVADTVRILVFSIFSVAIGYAWYWILTGLGSF